MIESSTFERTTPINQQDLNVQILLIQGTIKSIAATNQLAAERRRRVRPAGISGSWEAWAAFSATG